MQALVGGGGIFAPVAEIRINERSGNNITWFVSIRCLIAAMGGGSIFGYSIGLSGGIAIMSSFLERFLPTVYEEMLQETQNSSLSPPPPLPSDSSTTNQYCIYSHQKLTLFTTSLYMAAALASILASTVTTKYGRRASMICGGALSFSGAVLSCSSQSLWMVVVGIILLGFGVGFANQSVPLYISETAPPRHRGALNIGFQLFITIGIIAGNIPNYLFVKIKGGWGWRLSFGGAIVPSLILTVGSCFLHDTPISLIQRVRADEAKDELKKIRGTNDIDDEFRVLIAASETSRNTMTNLNLLLRRKYRPHLLMAILIPSFQQLTGITAMLIYASVLFGIIGFKENAGFMSAVVTGSVNVAATLVSVYGSDRWGRRSLLLKGGVQMLICQTIITIAISFVELQGLEDLHLMLIKWYAIIVVLFICIYVAGFAWSWGPLGWLMPSEIFPIEIRSAAQSINVSVNMIFTFAVALVFPSMLCHMKFGVFIFFGFAVSVMSCFVYYLLPETQGVPIEEMGKVWKMHRYWSRFVEDHEDLPTEEEGSM